MNKEHLEKLMEDTKDIESLFDNSEMDDKELQEIMDKFGINLDDLEKVFTEDLPKVKLSIKKINDDATIPSFAYETDSGFDLHSVSDYTIQPLGRCIVSTGLVFDIPENHEIQIRSKSGLAINQGIFVLNSPGTVDQGYTGEIKIILFNTNNEEFNVKKGMKIAQAVLCPVVCGKWVNIENVSDIESKDRNDKGFGSTGI
jgi:dUTP pyrophosphatase